MSFFKKIIRLRGDINSLIIKNNSSKITYNIIVFFFAFYISIVAFALAMPYIRPSGESLFEIIQIIFLFFVFAIVIYFFIIKLSLLVFKKDIKYFVINESTSTNRLNTKLAFSLIIFIPSFFNFLYNYPGGLTDDNISQWHQIQTFNFDNWHPVFHTFVLWLFAQIINHYAFVVFVQITIFSVSIAYLYSAMYSWGIPRKLLLGLCVLTSINSNTQSLMLFVMKDSAFSISAVLLTAMLINIYLSKGDWISNRKNLLLFSIALAATALFRHNGFFLTFPMLILITGFYFKKTNVKLLLPIFSLLIFLVRGPLYSALNVSYPDNTFQESVGVPMTIMGDVFVRHPDTFPEPGKSFMLEIATLDDWQKLYRHGNYNTIKYKSNSAIVLKKTDPKAFFEMVVGVIRFDLAYSVNAVLEVTSFVWNPYEKVEITYGFIDNHNLNIFKNKTISSFGAIVANSVSVLFSFMPPFLSGIGFLNLLMIFTLAMTFPLLGIRSTIFILPILCYNYGTMLLLCGPDYRFFHFNILVAIPICLVLFCKYYSKNRNTKCELLESGE